MKQDIYKNLCKYDFVYRKQHVSSIKIQTKQIFTNMQKISQSLFSVLKQTNYYTIIQPFIFVIRVWWNVFVIYQIGIQSLCPVSTSFMCAAKSWNTKKRQKIDSKQINISEQQKQSLILSTIGHVSDTFGSIFFEEINRSLRSSKNRSRSSFYV